MTSLVFLSKVDKIHNKQTIIKIQLTSTGGKLNTLKKLLMKNGHFEVIVIPQQKLGTLTPFAVFSLVVLDSNSFLHCSKHTPNGGRKLITQSMLVGGFNPSEKS